MENIEIRKADSLKSGGVKVDLAFNTAEFGHIVIKGFRVSRSKKDNSIWVQVPSYQAFGRYFPTFFVENESTWRDLESLLQDQFTDMESTKKSETEDEYVDPNEIPI
jgi:hypothetical protein